MNDEDFDYKSEPAKDVANGLKWVGFWIGLGIALTGPVGEWVVSP